MSIDHQLFVRVGGYLYSGLSLVELADWISDYEEHWAKLPEGHDAKVLADTIMLAWYETHDGSRDEDSVRDLIREEVFQATSVW